GIGGSLPQLVLDLVDDVTLAVGGYEKGRNPFLACARIGDREHDGQPRDLPRADELLAAVQDIAALYLGGTGTQRRGVRAGVGFGERERTDRSPADQIRQEALLLLQSAVLEQRRDDQAVLDRQNGRQRTVRGRDLHQ